MPLPKTPRERAEVRAAIWRMSQPDGPYALLTVVASVIASYGLLAGSAAVVIGAMLIAPLMGPILGMALGVAQGDTVLLRRAARSELLGVGLALAISLAIGLAPFRLDLGDEVLSRTRPTLYDLVIALAAGVGAAYALVDRRVSPSLPGVAIATSLVPPLTACGLCVASGRWSWAGGAALLFVANLLAIVTTGAATFIVVGLRRPGLDGASVLHHGRRLLVYAVAVVVVGLHMGHTLAELIREHRLGGSITACLEEELGALGGARITDLRNEWTAEELRVSMTVVASVPLEADDVDVLEKALRARVDPGISLTARSVVVRDCTSRGPIAVAGQADRQDAEAEERAQTLATAQAVLQHQLASEPGRTVTELASKPSPTGPVLSAVVRGPEPVAPAEVATAQEALRAALGRQIRLEVQSVMAWSVDADGFVASGGTLKPVTDANEVARLAAVAQDTVDHVLPGARVVGVRATVEEATPWLALALYAASELTPPQTRALEAALRVTVHPALQIRVVTLAGAWTTSDGYAGYPAGRDPVARTGTTPVTPDTTALRHDETLALSLASARDDVATVRRLMDGGADAAAAVWFGVTACHQAARASGTACLAELRARGALPGETDSLGQTPLDWARAAGNPAGVELIETR